MKVHIGEGATADEASAIATALATHLGTDIEVHIGADGEPAATGEPEYPLDDELGPTDREAALRAEVEDILQGGPEKYKQRLADQGKLFVRDRLDLWFGDEASDSGLRTGHSPPSTSGIQRVRSRQEPSTRAARAAMRTSTRAARTPTDSPQTA